MSKRNNLGLFVILSFSSLWGSAPLKPVVQVSDSPIVFVQSFFDWYVEKVNNNNMGGPAYVYVLKDRRDDLDKKLGAALDKDMAEQLKHPGEIAGLDGDPFLNTQDPGKHYRVGQAVKKGGRFYVDLLSPAGGGKKAHKDVVVELVSKDKRWVIVNIHYPDGDNLMHLLKILHPE